MPRRRTDEADERLWPPFAVMAVICLVVWPRETDAITEARIVLDAVEAGWDRFLANTS